MPIFDQLVAQGQIEVLPEMLDAIQCVRAEGIKTALLTNNWLSDASETHRPVDANLFDVVSPDSDTARCVA